MKIIGATAYEIRRKGFSRQSDKAKDGVGTTRGRRMITDRGQQGRNHLAACEQKIDKPDQAHVVDHGKREGKRTLCARPGQPASTQIPKEALGERIDTALRRE